MRKGGLTEGLAICVAGLSAVWIFEALNFGESCNTQCFMGVVALLTTWVSMIANLAMAASILIPSMRQYAKRSGAAVAASYGLSFALAYIDLRAPSCVSRCPLSTFDALLLLALLVGDIALVGIIFVEGTRLANRLRSSEVRTVTFSRLKGIAVLGWGLLILDDIVTIVGGRADGFTLLALIGTAVVAIWLATVQLAGER